MLNRVIKIPHPAYLNILLFIFAFIDNASILVNLTSELLYIFLIIDNYSWNQQLILMSHFVKIFNVTFCWLITKRLLHVNYI